jgi:DNA-binding beta-propeller fold protein YncE
MKIITKSIGLSTVLLALLLSGCASTPQVKERYFWPSPPEEPRIEWLGAYGSQLDLRTDAKSIFAEIVGEEDPDSLRNPAAAAADGEGRVYVGDLAKNAVMVFNFNMKEAHLLGGSATMGLFKNPSGIAFDADGNIYAGDLDENKIFIFDKNEKPLRTIKFESPVKSVGFFTIDKVKKRIIIPDVRGHKVHIADFDGKLIKTIDQFREKKDGFSFPTSAALDPIGNIIVADSMNSRILRFTPEGEYLSTIGQRGDIAGDIAMIKGVAVDSEGHIYMTDVKANRIQIYNEKGEILLAIGKQSNDPRVVGGFNAPTGIYIDQHDTIYVTEKLARRFQMFQYLNSRYLALHPITKDTAIAKPMAEDVKKAKGDEKKTPLAPLK